MKYSKMVEMSQEKSREKVARVKIEIQKMLDRKERVTVSGLERATGFSNSFFYRNEEVNQAVKEAQLKQGECYNPKKVIFDMALEIEKGHEKIRTREFGIAEGKCAIKRNIGKVTGKR